MLNTEKLDYNLQVLRRRDSENVFTKNSNSKKLSRKSTYHQHLQTQEAQKEAERKKKLKAAHLEIEKFTVKVTTKVAVVVMSLLVARVVLVVMKEHIG